jgi:hypothetical protein
MTKLSTVKVKQKEKADVMKDKRHPYPPFTEGLIFQSNFKSQLMTATLMQFQNCTNCNCQIKKHNSIQEKFSSGDMNKSIEKVNQQ